MSDFLSNPYLYLPHFTSAMRFDDMDSDATLNLFTYALDPHRNYADLNQRVDSFANRADVIAFQNAGIDLTKMLSGIPNMEVFQDRASGLAFSIRSSPNRSFRLTSGGPGLSGVLTVRGYKPLSLLCVDRPSAGDIELWAKRQSMVAVGGAYDYAIPGLQGGILEGDARWYVSKEIKLQRRWLGALSSSGDRPVAIKVALPRTSVEETPVHEPGQQQDPKHKDTSGDDLMRIMTINFHVGIGVNDEFFQLVDKLDPTIILGQECNGGKFGVLRQHLGKRYHISPTLALRVGREADATPVLMLKSAFPNVIGMGNRMVSPWKGGGENGRLWPTRYATWMVARHTSGKVVKARSFHAWVRGDSEAMQGRSKQFRSLADWSKSGDRVIAGGDFNASPDQILREYMQAVNMKLVASHTPDAIFTRGLAVTGQAEYPNPSHEGSHKVIVVRASI